MQEGPFHSIRPQGNPRPLPYDDKQVPLSFSFVSLAFIIRFRVRKMEKKNGINPTT